MRWPDVNCNLDHHCFLHCSKDPRSQMANRAGVVCRLASLLPFLVLPFLLCTSPSSCLFSGTPAFPPAPELSPMGNYLFINSRGLESGDLTKPHLQ